MKFNKKTLNKSLNIPGPTKKSFTNNRNQNVILSEEQFDRLSGILNESNYKGIVKTIGVTNKLIRESITREGLVLEQGQYNRNPGVAAGEGLEVVLDGFKKAYDMIKDSETRKKLANSITKLGNFMSTTAELMQSGAPGGHAVRHTDEITDEMPYPEFDLDEAVKPDFLDLDKDGDKEESMKKAAGEIEEGGMACESCGEVHEGDCGDTEEEGGFNQDKLEFGGFGLSESKKMSEKELIQEDIKKMKKVIKPVQRI